MNVRYPTESRNRYPGRSIQQPSPSPSPWMVSFGDLITLLFCLVLSLQSSGVFTIKDPTKQEQTSGSSFAVEEDEETRSSKSRHSPSKMYLTTEDLADIPTLRSRLQEMIPLDAPSLTIATESCRDPASTAILVDFAHIDAATASLQLPRTFSMSRKSCSEVVRKPTVAVISLSLESGAPSSSTDRGGEIR